MGKIYVFGHQNPDTDSICSTVAYTYLKKQLGVKNIEAYRLGELSKETAFVLDHFNVKVPPMLEDIDVRLSDLNLYQPPRISKHDPTKYAWDLLKSSAGSRLIPAVDKYDMLEGILSIGDLTKLLMEVSEDNITQKHEILFDNFLKILDAEVKYGQYKYRKIEGKIIIGSYSKTVKELNEGDVVVTSRIESAESYLKNTNCGCIIVTNNVNISSLANDEYNCAIVRVKFDIFKVVTLINQSISVDSIMKKDDLEVLPQSATIDDVKEIMKTSAHRNFPVVGDKGELVGIISRRHLIDYPLKSAILIDHNERSQSAEGIEKAQILEIIDHHRVADVQTDTPLYIRSEPVGCTSTIIYKMFKENSIDIPKKIAGIMLSAILSDTLIFNSPTCTNEDRLAAEHLALIAKVNIERYAKKMFKAGTSIENESFEELLAVDCKAFNFAGQRTFISQINTLDIDTIKERIDECNEAMNKFLESTGSNLMILIVTDIINAGSLIVVNGKIKILAEKAFGMDMNKNTIYLEGVVSRKKQIVPKLMMATRVL